jgi:phage virion morphogenesis protein
MASAEFNFDLRELDGIAKLLEQAKLSSYDRRQLLINIGVEVKGQTQERFDSQRDPEGNSWEQLDKKTRNYYTRNGFGSGFLLVQTGGLRDSIESQADGWSVLVGATKVYAATHQCGRGRIPKRPYLGISASNADDIMHVASQFLAERIG